MPSARNSSARNSSPSRAAREPLISKPNDPSRARKEETIRRKLRTYEMILALKEGYMPTTEQAVAWARYALRTSGVLDSRDRRLSAPGRSFVRDLRAFVEALVDEGLSKNSDDKIQEFIFHTSQAQIMGRVPDVQGAARSAVSGSSSDAKKAYSRLRLLGSLLYSSSEFRKLVTDFSVLARDIFADAASAAASTAGKAAETVRPSKEELEGVEKSTGAESEGTGGKDGLPSASKIRSSVKEKGTQYSEQARRKGYQTRDEIESYLREKFPKQRRDAIINRLKKIITDIQQNPDFEESVEFIMELAGKYFNSLKEKVMQEGSESKDTIQTDEHFEVALMDAKAIVMSLADGKPLDGINDAMKRVVEDIQSDQELQDFYNEVTTFFKRLLTEKDYVNSNAADAEAHRLYDRSQELLREKEDKYRPDVESLFEEIKSFLDAIANDKDNQRLMAASKKVFSDLVILDSRGNFKGLRKRVVKDLIDVVLPRFIGEVKYIPMPRIEYQDRDYDLVLENLVLESEHFIPYKTIFEAITKAEFTNDYTFTSKYFASTRVRLDNINLFAKDISFIVRKKTGLLQFSDRGFIDIFMDGRGASAEIVLDSATTDNDDYDEETDCYFHVRSVKVTINQFNYKYRAYHSWAAAMLSPVVRPMVRRLVSKMLEEKIKETFEKADRELHAMRERMRVANIASSGGGGNIESWIRAVLSRPEKRRSSARSGDYRVNVGTCERLFPGEHGPGAVLARFGTAKERVEELAEEDGGWRNEIFDLKF